MKKPFKKVSDNFYIVNFPNKTKEVYFDVYVKSGYFDESEKEFGTGHLLEHYLLESIPDKEKFEFSNGLINNDFTDYYIKSENKNAIRDINLFLKGVFRPDFSNKVLLSREKKVIANEIGSKKDIKVEAFDFLLKENFGNNFLYARDKINQIKNIKKIELSDLKKYHEKIFNKRNVLFVLSGYNLNKNIEKEVLNIIDGYKFKKSSVKNEKKIKTSKFYKNKIIKNQKYNWNDKVVFNLCFNFPVNLSKSHKNLKTLVLIRDYFEDQKFSFAKEMRDLGIYSISLDRIIWRNDGIIILSAQIEKEKVVLLKKKFIEFLDNIIKEGIPEKDLLKLKKMQKERLEKSFSDNIKRLGWIANDLIFHGKITPLKEDLVELRKIDLNYIKKFSKQVFDVKKSNIILFGKGSEKIKI